MVGGCVLLEHFRVGEKLVTPMANDILWLDGRMPVQMARQQWLRNKGRLTQMAPESLLLVRRMVQHIVHVKTVHGFVASIALLAVKLVLQDVIVEKDLLLVRLLTADHGRRRTVLSPAMLHQLFEARALFLALVTG